MRERLLIKVLNGKGIVSLKSITSTLELSERTIRNEIKKLNKIGEESGFRVCNKRGQGYILEIINKKEFEAFWDKMGKCDIKDITYMPEERVNKIIEILLVRDNKITIDSIAEELGYSRSTVIKDLELVEKKISNLNLNLERKTNKGLKLKNTEVSIRKSLSTYLYNTNTDFIIQSEINGIIFAKIKKIFIEEIIINKIDISNLAIENIFCHLNILILRIYNKSFLKNNLKLENIESKFLMLAEKICNVIGEEFQINIPKIEAQYLASQIYYKSRIVSNENEIKFRATNDVGEILQKIDKEFYTDFSEDEELKNNLIIHLCALITRARANTQLKNPYFEEVNTRYSSIVSIVVNFTDEFCKRWNLRLLKDEIAFITIHFATHFEKIRLKKLKDVQKIAIVCPRDGGIQYFLRLKIEENFRNVVIDSYCHLQIEELNKKNYDFIISDKSIEVDDKKIPIFKVNNLFDELEIDKIVSEIEKMISLEQKLRTELLEGIAFKRVRGGTEIKYKDFLKNEANVLVGMGICGEGFVDSVLKREEALSTAYRNNIAAPHGIEMNAYKNFLSVIIFDEVIEWEEKKVNIIFLMAMKKGNLQLHKVLSKKVFNLINDNEKRLEINKIYDKKKFIEFFETL